MKTAARVTISVALLALLFWLLPWDDVREAARRVRGEVWLVVLGGFLAGHLLGLQKWRLLVNGGGAALGARDAMRAYSAGLFTNLCLPTIVGGDLVRAGLAARSTGRGEAAVFAGVVDRAVDIGATGLLIAVGAMFARGTLPPVGRALVSAALLVGTVFVVLFVPLVLRRPLARWPRRFRRRVARVLIALRSLASAPGAVVVAVLISLAMQGAFVLLNAWLGGTLGIDVPLAVWFVAWPLAKIAGLLPISLGGLAVRDATFAALLVPAGVPMSQGVVAALVWQTVLIAGGLIAGCAWWMLGRDGVGVRAAADVALHVAPGHE